MNVISAIRKEFLSLGYSTDLLPEGYRFSDVFESTAPIRSVPLAVFTDNPCSYRNAAFGILTDASDPKSAIETHRALGANVWFCITANAVQLWDTSDPKNSFCRGVEPLDSLHALFARNRDAWTPDRIVEARRKGLWNRPEQSSLFERPDLVKLIEVYTQRRLDRVITRVLKILATSSRTGTSDFHRAYRACFYFLAAKIVFDRNHPVSSGWSIDDAAAILDEVSQHYKLNYARDPGNGIARNRLQEAWDTLRGDVSFANISADDLAFVYENTLVSPETRRALGTHSTPRAVAQFLVSRLDLDADAVNLPKLYEPYCGAAVLLVAALSAIRPRLPRTWTQAQRHTFLVRRLRGADVDAFACEVASLSLILADYPSRNGWDIRRSDLFEAGVLAAQIDPGTVVLCNPPFEDFDLESRNRYTHTTSVKKPIQVLTDVLSRNPKAIGFVLPHAIIADTQYGALRKQLERQFEEIELISLPDRVFVQSGVESALLVAKHPRPARASTIVMRSAEVPDTSRESFLKGLHQPEFRAQSRWSDPQAPQGDIWVPPLVELWEFLQTYPRLGSVASVHRGIEWASGWQSQAVAHHAKSGYRRGVHNSSRLTQFSPPEIAYLDCRPEKLRGGAIDLPWEKPKVVLNAARKSRGPWRVAATRDVSGLVLSQQLIACWPRDGDMAVVDLLEGVLNGPLAAAFVTTHDTRKRFRTGMLEQIPIPRRWNHRDLSAQVENVRRVLNENTLFVADIDASLNRALLQLDAAILAAYELPPRLERQLLRFFENCRGARPVISFLGYPAQEGGMARSLSEILARQFDDMSGDWVDAVFSPLPAAERAQVMRFLS